MRKTTKFVLKTITKLQFLKYISTKAVRQILVIKIDIIINFNVKTNSLNGSLIIFKTQ
jgi:hypothetical protein